MRLFYGRQQGWRWDRAPLARLPRWLAHIVGWVYWRLWGVPDRVGAWFYWHVVVRGSWAMVDAADAIASWIVRRVRVRA